MIYLKINAYLSMRIVGIDETGRGCLIGPLFICGVAIEEEKLPLLKEMGAKDSKLLTPAQREKLAVEIKKVVEYYMTCITAEEIDMKSNLGINLNRQEAMKMAECINALKPGKVIIDAPSGIKIFVNNVKRYSSHTCEIVAEHKADVNYPIVGAASILAKVTRDEELRRIEKEVGIPLGVGYTHDSTTIESVKNNFKNELLMKYVRKNWITYANIKRDKEQRKLDF